MSLTRATFTRGRNHLASPLATGSPTASGRTKWGPRTIAYFVGAVAFAAARVPLAHAQPQLPEAVYTWPMGNASQNATMASLAGIANRITNGEVLLSPNNGTLPNPRFWLDRLKESYPQVQSQQ